ncbi:MAG: hypothetical protein U1F43_25830 [Myxococcota bacterium]
MTTATTGLGLALLAGLAACGDTGDDFALACPPGTTAYRAPGAALQGGAVVVEEWCKTALGVAEGPYRAVDETGIGTNGERGHVVPGPVVLVLGQFADGLADGEWLRWTKRYYAANFTLDPLGLERWDRGLAEGTWLDYSGELDAAGVPVVAGQRSYKGGVACGTWSSGAAVTQYLPCADVGLVAASDTPLPPPDDPLGAPVTTDTGWDGLSCPDGSAPIPEASDVHALACWKAGLRDGPFGRWLGVPGAALDAPFAVGRKRDDGAYTAGKRSGTWRSWHSNGILAAVGDFGTDGERSGSWRRYYADGWLVERADFVAGLRSGAVETYHDGGHRASTETWLHGSRDGAYAAWLADGTQLYAGRYTHGLKDGDWSVWSDELGSRTKLVEHWDRGTPVGTWFMVYEPSGARAGTTTFVNGLGEGPVTQWWESGAERLTGHLAGGERWGTWKTFYEDGTEASEQTFVGGHLEGPAKTFYPHGSPESEGVYEQDARVYVWTFWDAAGNARTCDYATSGDPSCP